METSDLLGGKRGTKDEDDRLLLNATRSTLARASGANPRQFPTNLSMCDYDESEGKWGL